MSARAARINGLHRHILCQGQPRPTSAMFAATTRPSSRHYSIARPDNHVRIVEVGPRDGLQNEKKTISLETKLELIRRLAKTGLDTIEAGSFVSPKWVPQMNNSDKILQSLLAKPPSSTTPITYQWLLPNQRGFDNFTNILSPSQSTPSPPAPNTSPASPNALPITPGPSHEIAIFLAATETFSQRNTNRSIASSLDVSERLIRDSPVPVRAYISVAFGCPFEGRSVSPSVVADMSARLLEAGAYEISVADTTGTGTPEMTREVLRALRASDVPVEKTALHFHDTFGLALVNVLQGLEGGVRTFDAAVAGLGGCPFSPGATGNVGTEDLVYAFQEVGMKTGVNLEAVAEVGGWISGEVGRANESRAGKGVLGRLSADRAKM